MLGLPLTPRLLTRNTILRQPFGYTAQSSIRLFSTSPANMTIKTYFDVAWQGPVLDANSKPTRDVQGELQLPHLAHQLGAIEYFHHRSVV